jgi:four helix bundle protein
MNENPVLDKSFNFALRIIKLYKYLTEEKREFVLSKELLVSGTNIGKHVKEAVNAETRAVFIRILVGIITSSRLFKRQTV